jgi:protein-disulfide isomerase
MASSAAFTARQRRRRRQLVGVIAVVAVGVAVLVATGGGGAEQTPPKNVIALVDATIGGIPQHANMLGSPRAPVTLQYFGDLECPFCREFTVYSLPNIIAKWVRKGKLRIIYRSMETATTNPQTFELQQVAAEAAGLQNKMWYYIELFYHEQGAEDSGYVTEPFLAHLARQVPNLNLSRWQSDRNEPALAAEVRSDKQTAQQAGIPGTPGLFFGRTGGGLKLYRPPTLRNPAEFEGLIEKLVTQ